MPHRASDAGHVRQRVRIGEREPEAVLGQAQQDGVVHDASPGRGEEHVARLHHLDLREIAAGDQVHELEGVRAADLDATLDRHVPQRDVVPQCVVLGDRVLVQRRQEHVVVQTPALATVALRRVVVRRLPVPGLDVEGEALRCHVRLLRTGSNASDAEPSP